MQELLREQRQRRAANRREIEVAKAAAVQAGRRANATALMAVNRDTVVVFKTQQDLEKQSQQLATETAEFAKQANRWLDAFQGLNLAVERLDGLESWAQGIEDDLSAITDSLEEISSGPQATATLGDHMSDYYGEDDLEMPTPPSLSASTEETSQTQSQS